MAIDVDNIQVFEDADLLKLYRNALANIAVGQNYEINGRKLTRADLADVRETIEYLEQKVAAASGPSIALTRMGQPQ